MLMLFIILLCTNSLYSQVTRKQVISAAEAYVNYSWTADSINIWKNVDCSSLGNILTPAWVTVGAKTAIPYCWGGWSSIQSFATGITNGKSAGDNDCTTNGDLYEKCAVGVDCSGFVTKVWGINSQKYSTSTLPNISKSIALSATQPGDILNWAGHHTRLVFANNLSTTGFVDVIESSGTDWKVAKHSYKPSDLASYGSRCANTNIVIDTTKTVFPDISNGPEIIVYPNPSSGLLIIKSISLGTDNLKIILSNTMGQVLIEKQIKPQNNLIETRFDISEFPKGIYFLNISSSKINRVIKVQKQ